MMRKGTWIEHLLLVATGVAWAVAVWGAWIPHPAVALRVAGVDMAEVVKFLPGVRAGRVHIWREGFLLPQVTLSVFLSLHAWQRRWAFPAWARVLLQVIAAAVALSMLPPAWSPVTLRAAEWQLQVRLIGLCLVLAVLSPLTRLLPPWLVDGLLAALGMASTLVVVSNLTRAWPEFERVYNMSLSYGVGLWALGAGTTGLLVVLGEGLRHRGG